MFGGNDYGGGYMPNSPSHGSQGSPGGERRAASQSLRPLTIKQIMGAEQTHTDAEMYVDGVEVSQITSVAQVISVNAQTTHSAYTLDDGTGRIEARLWSDRSAGDDSSEGHDIIKEGIYVRVTGIVKSFSNKRYINATNIRPAKDPYEVYFHLQEVAYVALVCQRGPPNGSKSNGINSMSGGTAVGGSTSSNYSHYTSSTTTANDQYAGVSVLARRIIDYMASQPKTDEGIHVASVARHINEDAGAISQALDELMDNGHVFSTIDESHFALAG